MSELCSSESFTINEGTELLAGKAPTVSAEQTNVPAWKGWAEYSIDSIEIATAASLEVSDAPVTVGPNPTLGAAQFAFGLAADGEVLLTVFDLQGRSIATILDGPMQAGPYTVSLDERLPAGVYVCQLRAGDRVETGRLTVVRQAPCPTTHMAPRWLQLAGRCASIRPPR